MSSLSSPKLPFSAQAGPATMGRHTRASLPVSPRKARRSFTGRRDLVAGTSESSGSALPEENRRNLHNDGFGWRGNHLARQAEGRRDIHSTNAIERPHALMRRATRARGR